MITPKNNELTNCIEVNLSETNVRNNIINHYLKGEKFACDNQIFDSENVHSIKITKTDHPFNYYLSKVEAKRRGVVSNLLGGSDEYRFMTNYGTDVTREFIHGISDFKKKKMQFKFSIKNWQDNIYLYLAIGILIVVLGGLIHNGIINNNFSKILNSNISNLIKSEDTVRDSVVIFGPTWVYEDESFLVFDNQLKFHVSDISDSAYYVFIDVYFFDVPKEIVIHKDRRAFFEYIDQIYFIDILKYRDNMIEIVISKKIN